MKLFVPLLVACGIFVGVARPFARSFAGSASLWVVLALVAATAFILTRRAIQQRDLVAISDKWKLAPAAALIASALVAYDVAAIYTRLSGVQKTEPAIAVYTSRLKRCRNYVEVVTASKNKVNFCSSYVWRVGSGGAVRYRQSVFGTLGRS